MAAGKRGAGPGAYTENGVNCTMNAPFSKAARQREGVGGGEYGKNKAPFEKAQSMGGGGIQTKFYDGMPAKMANRQDTSSAGASSVIGITKRNPTERRFKNAK